MSSPLARTSLRALLASWICALLLGWLPSTVQAREESLATITQSALPVEARDTLALIRRGGPFPYSRDGIEFRNRERLLPARPRYYYREYTVPTPGARTRGARRIIAGAQEEYYYTADHYRSFRRILP